LGFWQLFVKVAKPQTVMTALRELALQHESAGQLVIRLTSPMTLECPIPSTVVAVSEGLHGLAENLPRDR
jgi:hypothetical protein